MKKYKIVGCYTQWFEIEVQAEDEDEAQELALSGEEDLTITNCDDWFVDTVKEIK